MAEELHATGEDIKHRVGVSAAGVWSWEAVNHLFLQKNGFLGRGWREK